MLPKDFSQFQVVGLVSLGGIYWGMAAYIIRRFSPSIFANDRRRISLFLTLIPISYVTLGFSEGLLGIESKERLTSTAIMCSSALFLDGIIFMWFPTIYENPELKQKNPPAAVAYSRMGAASILYGVAVLLSIALLT